MEIFKKITPEREIIYDKSANDITTGFSGEDFIINEEPNDPFAKESFITLVDSIINHKNSIFPHPTKKSSASDQNIILPELFTHLINKQLLNSYSTLVASDIQVEDDDLNNYFKRFRIFSISEKNKLKDWIEYHFNPNLRYKHFIQLPRDIQPFVEKYWSETQQCKYLSSELGIESYKLRYAFDVYYRGLQYDTIIVNEDALYLSHPLRYTIFDNNINNTFQFKNLRSWGEIIAFMLENKLFSRKLDEVVDLIDRIKRKVINDSSWYCEIPLKERIEREIEVVSQEKIDVRIKEKVINNLQIVSTTASGAADALLNTFGIITLLVNIGFVKIKDTKPDGKGKITKIKFTRGLFDWDQILKR